MLPKHGKVQCRACFRSGGNTISPHTKWRMFNDPGAWGSSAPRYLVLGFSKGSTQVDVYQTGRFEDVAFAGMRDRLSQALQVIGVLGSSVAVDIKIADPESDIAFGSMIRCSVSRYDEKASVKSGNPVYGCTGPLITKSFDEISEVINRCADRFLVGLPPSVESVFFLGNTDSYVVRCQELIARLFPADFQKINPMAVFADGRLWIHLAHPSRLNGHFRTWLNDDTGSGLKRLQALEALTLDQGRKRSSRVKATMTNIDVPPKSTNESRAMSAQIGSLGRLAKYRMYAQGKNDIYVPYQDGKGKYPLYSKLKMRQTGDPIHHASNKELANSIDEAIRLVKQGTHHIRLRGLYNKQCNVFSPENVKIVG